jgi:hypothetical protein
MTRRQRRATPNAEVEAQAEQWLRATARKEPLPQPAPAPKPPAPKPPLGTRGTPGALAPSPPLDIDSVLRDHVDEHRAWHRVT